MQFSLAISYGSTILFLIKYYGVFLYFVHVITSFLLFTFLPLICFQSAVTCLCFTPNSDQVITASKDGTLKVWNINGRCFFFFPKSWLINSNNVELLIAYFKQ